MCKMASLAQGGESDSERSQDGREPGVCLATLAQGVSANGWAALSLISREAGLP